MRFLRDRYMKIRTKIFTGQRGLPLWFWSGLYTLQSLYPMPPPEDDHQMERDEAVNFIRMLKALIAGIRTLKQIMRER